MIKKMYCGGLILAMSLMLVSNSQSVVKAAEPYETFTSTEEWEVLKETNKYRNDDGKEGFSTFSLIQEGAQIRADEIVDIFSHTRPDGSSCFTVVKEKGIKYTYTGENIAAGQRSPQAVLNSWMNSSGHKANIMSDNFSHLGAGYKLVPDDKYGKYWVQLFVGGCTTTNIAMDTSDVQTYAKETTIDQMNRYLVITCNLHDVSYMPITDKMCTGYNKSEIGEQTITVTYHDLTTTFNVMVTSEVEDIPDDTPTDKPSDTPADKPSDTPADKPGDNPGDGLEDMPGNNPGDEPGGVPNDKPSTPSKDASENVIEEKQDKKKVKKPGKVTKLTAKRVSAKKVKLTWNKKSSDGYEIYMKTGSGKYKKIKTIKNAKTTSYTVKKLKKGKKYTFKVRAYRLDGKKKIYGKFSATRKIS